MNDEALVFNPPPGWPAPPEGWRPPAGWSPDPTWPEPPDGWELWVPGGRSTHETESGTRSDAGASALPPGSEEQQSPSDVEPALVARVAELEAENAALRAIASRHLTGDETLVLDDDRVLQSVGIYRYHHPLESAVAYKHRLGELDRRIAASVKAGTAIVASNMFTFDNSLARGRRMVADLSNLMLRAYNAEADNCVRSLRAGNVVTAIKRLEITRSSIAKLGAMMQMQISDEFHALRLEELELTADWLMKKQEEKEAAREERARLREERRVQQELAAQRDRLAKERAHLFKAVEAVRATGSSDPNLETSLAEIEAAIAENDYRAANIRAGYVYVVSNRGSFGPGVVKIGLTRRLEPLDRIIELGDASVPFRFDVHALYFSEDAVSLEAELHRGFADRALNLMNPRKEFFFATPAEVRAALEANVGALLEFTEQAEAVEYLQSVNAWPTDAHRPGARAAAG